MTKMLGEWNGNSVQFIETRRLGADTWSSLDDAESLTRVESILGRRGKLALQ